MSKSSSVALYLVLRCQFEYLGFDVQEQTCKLAEQFALQYATGRSRADVFRGLRSAFERLGQESLVSLKFGRLPVEDGALPMATALVSIPEIRLFEEWRQARKWARGQAIDLARSISEASFAVGFMSHEDYGDDSDPKGGLPWAFGRLAAVEEARHLGALVPVEDHGRCDHLLRKPSAKRI